MHRKYLCETYIFLSPVVPVRAVDTLLATAEAEIVGQNKNDSALGL